MPSLPVASSKFAAVKLTVAMISPSMGSVVRAVKPIVHLGNSLAEVRHAVGFGTVRHPAITVGFTHGRESALGCFNLLYDRTRVSDGPECRSSDTILPYPQSDLRVG
ncbi:hypothetical protein KRMM14A1004_04470 [Krasilnikovia sp. MM14-A1004]